MLFLKTSKLRYISAKVNHKKALLCQAEKLINYWSTGEWIQKSIINSFISCCWEELPILGFTAGLTIEFALGGIFAWQRWC